MNDTPAQGTFQPAPHPAVGSSSDTPAVRGGRFERSGAVDRVRETPVTSFRRSDPPSSTPLTSIGFPCHGDADQSNPGFLTPTGTDCGPD